jgi:hypothetical protein
MYGIYQLTILKITLIINNSMISLKKLNFTFFSHKYVYYQQIMAYSFFHVVITINQYCTSMFVRRLNDVWHCSRNNNSKKLTCQERSANKYHRTVLSAELSCHSDVQYILANKESSHLTALKHFDAVISNDHLSTTRVKFP